jgi:hypothetical protein
MGLYANGWFVSFFSLNHVSVAFLPVTASLAHWHIFTFAYLPIFTLLFPSPYSSSAPRAPMQRRL